MTPQEEGEGAAKRTEGLDPIANLHSLPGHLLSPDPVPGTDPGGYMMVTGLARALPSWSLLSGGRQTNKETSISWQESGKRHGERCSRARGKSDGGGGSFKLRVRDYLRRDV